jgi:hypothetical protein
VDPGVLGWIVVLAGAVLGVPEAMYLGQLT